MRLNHLDLQVADVQATTRFIVELLGYELKSSPTAPTIAILESEGFTLILQRKEAPVYPDGFHIGFYVADRTLVDENRKAFIAEGHRVSAIENNRRGYFFYGYGPGDLLVEINCRAN